MGQSFNKQIDLIQHQQLEWVPREPDVNGGGNQGMRLVGMVYGESLLFNALPITDTSAHMSLAPSGSNPEGTPYDQVYAVYKTALVVSTLNQSVTIQPMWSRDRTNWYPFNTSVTVISASGGNPQTAIIALSTPSIYVPYVGLQATCTSAPTSGVLNAWLERLG